MLETVIVPAKSKHTHTIFWLHGLGADGHDFEGIVPELDLPPSLGIQFVFPHAPHRAITINGGMHMRAWYDITRSDLDGLQHDMQSMHHSATAIQALMQAEVAKGITPDRIVLIGFSQGGVISILTGLKAPCAGVVVLSAYYPTSIPLATATHAMPILFTHGTQDSVLPVSLGKASYEHLKTHGYNVSWRDYPMQHQVCQEELRDVSAFIRLCFRLPQ